MRRGDLSICDKRQFTWDLPGVLVLQDYPGRLTKFDQVLVGPPQETDDQAQARGGTLDGAGAVVVRVGLVERMG
jgi:hypothetical protein